MLPEIPGLLRTLTRINAQTMTIPVVGCLGMKNAILSKLAKWLIRVLLTSHKVNYPLATARAVGKIIQIKIFW